MLAVSRRFRMRQVNYLLVGRVCVALMLLLVCWACNAVLMACSMRSHCVSNCDVTSMSSNLWANCCWYRVMLSGGHVACELVVLGFFRLGFAHVAGLPMAVLRNRKAL